MRRIGFLAVFSGLVFATAAQATPITRIFNLSTDGYSTGILHAGPAPTDPFTASITVTFDPTVETPDQTTGVTLNSYNIPLDASPIGFNFDTASDQLEFGLIENGVAGFSLTTNDFTVSILHPESATPLLSLAFYSDQASNDFYEASNGKVGFTTPTAVPEPSSIALLLFGLAGCALLMRRRRTLAA